VRCHGTCILGCIVRCLLTILIALLSSPARGADATAADIVAVLYRSQQVRLDAMPLAEASLRAVRVRDSFDALTRRLEISVTVELRVIRGETVAETLHGNVVVANEALGDLPESGRLFVLAHELGHVQLGHWSQMEQLYRKWVPGSVTQRQTDAIAVPLSRDASALAHRQEFEADAFGLRTLRALGLKEQDALAAFMDLGARNDTATHPSTRKRFAMLRSIEPDSMHAAAPLGPPALPVDAP
jgi:Zn-dependent protease with chaperone function